MQTASKLELDSRVVSEMADKIRGAVELLSTNAEAARIFQAIEEGHGKASGWAIVRTLGMQAGEAQELLEQLKAYGLVDSTDAGLDGYYYLTKLGFALRSGMRIAV
jgi:DNA-binding IclR family transcriptional regulator